MHQKMLLSPSEATLTAELHSAEGLALYFFHEVKINDLDRRGFALKIWFCPAFEPAGISYTLCYAFAMIEFSLDVRLPKKWLSANVSFSVFSTNFEECDEWHYSFPGRREFWLHLVLLPRKSSWAKRTKEPILVFSGWMAIHTIFVGVLHKVGYVSSCVLKHHLRCCSYFYESSVIKIKCHKGFEGSPSLLNTYSCALCKWKIM